MSQIDSENLPDDAPEEDVLVKFKPIGNSTEEKGKIVATPVAPPTQYPIALPVIIVLLTLLGTSGRDIATLNKRKAALVDESFRIQTESSPLFQQASKTSELIVGLKKDLTELAPTTPWAAKIVSEFFPPNAKSVLDSEDKKEGNDAAAATPTPSPAPAK